MVKVITLILTLYKLTERIPYRVYCKVTALFFFPIRPLKQVYDMSFSMMTLKNLSRIIRLLIDTSGICYFLG